MDLYIVRHAWAGSYGDPRWPDDRQRPLTKQGRKRFKKVAKKLVKRGFAPQLIVTSPLVRCRQTAEILVDALQPEVELKEHKALEPDGNLVELITWIGEAARQYESIACVGHSPDIAELTAELIGVPGANIRFAKGAVACVRFQGVVERGLGQLRWLVTAKLLGC